MEEMARTHGISLDSEGDEFVCELTIMERTCAKLAEANERADAILAMLDTLSRERSGEPLTWQQLSRIELEKLVKLVRGDFA